MPTTLKQVLLEDGGHGTVPFVVGSERRAIHGYPLVMASRSSLMAATDWSSQTDDSDAEPHHLLADQRLTDEQWKLGQCLWLYAHGIDQAFEGISVSDPMAEQLRGYLGIDDCSELRRATNRPLVPSEELQRVEAILRPVIGQVSSLEGDRQFKAATKLDAAMQQHVLHAYEEATSGWCHVTQLVYPLLGQCGGGKLPLADWNYRGQLAHVLPPHIRNWINTHRVHWMNTYGNDITLTYGDNEAMAETTFVRIYELLGSEAPFLSPTSVPLADGGEHVVLGLAQGMHNSVSFDQASAKRVSGKPVRGEREWTQLVQHYSITPLVVVAELLHEVIEVAVQQAECQLLEYYITQWVPNNRSQMAHARSEAERRRCELHYQDTQERIGKLLLEVNHT